MELLKQIAMDLLLVAFGIFGVTWQIFQWRDKSIGRLILWIGIIPLPIGLAGLVCLGVGLHELGRLAHLF